MSLHYCLQGQHTLIKIYEDGSDMSSNVVRWCEGCGAIVIDKDFDGRTNAGQVMKMKFPKISHYKKNYEI